MYVSIDWFRSFMNTVVEGHMPFFLLSSTKLAMMFLKQKRVSKNSLLIYESEKYSSFPQFKQVQGF